MKKTIFSALALVTVCCLVLFTQGCGHSHEHEQDHARDRSMTSPNTAKPDAHAALHAPKQGGVFAEFPGHKYAVEIIGDETTGLVTALLTNAHFEPIAVNSTEIQLNFVVNGTPKTFVLAVRAEQEEGKPAAFTLTDKELATLVCDGWQGDAAASVAVGGTQYNAKLVKLSGQGHVH